MPNISIVIPVRNEEKNIENIVKKIDITLNDAHLSYEIIIVDDHSTDKTYSISKKLSKIYSVQYFQKKGTSGKGYSILEGADNAQSDIICMIDADLQYNPKHIPEMYNKLVKNDTVGVVIAERKIYKTSLMRKLGSKMNALFIGKLLMNLPYDIQSGLKIFRKDVIMHVSEDLIGPWSLDIPLLKTAKELGYTIATVPIIFDDRDGGVSKISFLRTAHEISTNALKMKFKHNRRVFHVPAHNAKSMKGAGVIFKQKKFITHSSLHPDISALHVLQTWQKYFIFGAIALLILAASINVLNTFITFLGLLTTLYFFDVLFNLFMVVKTLHFPEEIKVTDKEVAQLKDNDLPIYTVFCPLYKEAHMIPQFVKAMDKLEYPKEKLDIMLLLEEDDTLTIKAAQDYKLPKHIRIVVVPDSFPKTKPKATNFGLAEARGEFSVIYDAEDIPDPLQLKKTLIAFERSDNKTVCIQAKLNYYNPHQNLLTRVFTAEYSLWFDLVLPGLQSVSAPIPLGGTSNHFKTSYLHELEGWDSFNVTEDCDLGIRLAKKGYKTAIVDSVTMEEANSHLGNWVYQRTRWIKGYMQSYLVHMRNPREFFMTNPRHFMAFQLVVGGKILSLFINPIMWLITILYFTFRATLGVQIEKLFPGAVLYMGLFSLVIGNFLYLYYYMIGCAKRKEYALIKYVYIVPFYWLAMSYAAWKALIQLMHKPHFWPKTTHGLHLQTAKIHAQDIKTLEVSIAKERPQSLKINHKKQEIQTWTIANISGGTILVAGYSLANVLNFLFQATLGRVLSFENFGLLTLVNTFSFLISILLFSLGSTVTHRISYLSAKYGEESGLAFLSRVYRKSVIISFLASCAWGLLIPFLKFYFQLDSILPLLMFYPILWMGLIGSLNEGFLQGKFLFVLLAIVTVSAPLLKLVLGFGLTYFGLQDLSYIAIPLATVFPVIVSSFFVWKNARNIPKKGNIHAIKFPKSFFSASLLTILSTSAFLSVDLILVKHYLSAIQAGQYALIGLIGKIVFYFGSLVNNLMMTFVSRDEGANRSSDKTFNRLLLATITLTGLVFVVVGPLGHIVTPILFGEKVYTILPFISEYALAIAFITITQALLLYHLAKHHYVFSLTSLISVCVMIIAIILHHASVREVVNDVLFASILNFSLIVSLHVLYRQRRWIKSNIRDLLDVFTHQDVAIDQSPDTLKVLIFNWYCVKHTWAGGAEYYVHNIAKSLVKKGHSVTLFCGNDGSCLSTEVIDGVNIIRHGGLFTVGIWAYIYYMTKFKYNFDVIIDSAKGVPFFTPIYAIQPVVSLICHVHQDMFKKGLIYPLAQIAMYLEKTAMPFVYASTPLVTISPSSRKAIHQLGFDAKKKIEIVYPGVDDVRKMGKKTKNPSLLYLGRLRDYKNVDILIKCIPSLLAKYPKLTVTIAGEGESMKSLKRLTHKLGVQDVVTFTGRVTDEQKNVLFTQAWIVVHPSIVEGWGISNIEANLCGTPVVAANVDGLRDSVIHSKTGLLVESKNVPAFIAAIDSLLSDEKRRNEMGLHAKKWAAGFSWEASAESFYTLFSKLINTSPSYFRVSSRRANIRI